MITAKVTPAGEDGWYTITVPTYHLNLAGTAITQAHKNMSVEEVDARVREAVSALTGVACFDDVSYTYTSEEEQ